MVDLKNFGCCPTAEELGEYIRNPLFAAFCKVMKEQYNITGKAEFSKCSLEYGWNLKFKKAGKNLCTLYPGEGCFTLLIVVGNKEKVQVEQLLPSCCSELQEIYRQTREANGQRWLMLDLEDDDTLYRDALCLIEIRKNS